MLWEVVRNVYGVNLVFLMPYTCIFGKGGTPLEDYQLKYCINGRESQNTTTRKYWRNLNNE